MKGPQTFEVRAGHLWVDGEDVTPCNHGRSGPIYNPFDLAAGADRHDLACELYRRVFGRRYAGTERPPTFVLADWLDTLGIEFTVTAADVRSIIMAAPKQPLGGL